MVGGPGERGPEERLDELQRLWTPWRMAYIRGPGDPDGGCPFCRLPAQPEAHDRESLILARGSLAYVMLNAFPYNPGHLMVIPFRHVAEFSALTTPELHEIGDLTQRGVVALQATSQPHGFNMGINVGGVAGAGIADHIHQHVVPRWGGDTNFMPVVGQTRVLPELLEETYERLAPAFDTG